MNIRIDREGRNNVEISVINRQIRVFAPFNLPLNRIKRIVESQIDWIQNRLTAQNTASNGHVEFSDSGKYVDSRENSSNCFAFKEIMLFGTNYPVLENDKKKTILLNDCVLINGSSSYDKRRSECKKLLKSICEEKLTVLASVVYSKMGVCPCGIQVKPFSKGCSLFKGVTVGDWAKIENRVAVFDIQTVQLPAILQRYIVVSVGAHMLVGKTNKQYYDIVRNFSIDSVTAEKRLREYCYLKELFC